MLFHATQEQVERCAQAFAAFDSDGTGKLSKDELEHVITHHGGVDAFSADEIKQLVNELGLDQPGQSDLQYRQFAEMIAPGLSGSI